MKSKKFIEEIFVHQHDMTDCGAACLLSLIKYYGGDSSILHLREISGTSNTGTTLLGLYQAAQTMGFDANGAQANGIKDLIEHEKPCILSVVIDKVLLHYIVCYGYESGHFMIGDPAKGVVEMSESELESIWTKKCLLLEPNSNFEKKENITEKKKSWFKDLIHDDLGILAAIVPIGLIVATLGMVMSVFSQRLVDDVLPSRNMTKLIAGLVLVLLLLIIKELMNALRSRLLIKQKRDFNNRIILSFFSKLLNLPKQFFDTRKTGDMVARLNDTRRIQTVIGTIVGDTMINALIAIVAIIFIFIYSWKVAIIVLVFMPLFYWIIARNNKTIITQQREVMGSYAMNESGFINTINGVTEIKLFSKQDVFLKICQLLYSVYQGKSYELGKTGIRISLSAGISGIVIQMSIIALCSFFVINDEMTIGDLVAIIGITGLLFSSIASLALVMIPINEAKVAFARMYEIVDAQEEKVDESNEGLENKSITADKLELRNLAFRFVGRKRLFDDISVEFKKGTITSIVGESGCGKSTLCQLLERFYQPEEGTICLDGVTVNEIPLNQWRDMLSIVPQDVYLYNGTVMDNICFGEEQVDINKMVEFCQKYGFDKFIMELPNGLHTLVGEEGINLSGGQKQLVAFARAMYHPGKIYILDEMTAAMDRMTEKHICKLLSELKKDNIVIFVTHRLETARLLSDKIVVMEKGKITATGTHDSLMTTENFYSDYWNSIK